MPASAHFVTFYSPGTFVADGTCKPIGAWDVPAAIAMAKEITERYGARPFAFRFSTRARGDADLDSKEVARSSMHFIGCIVRTIAEVEAAADPKEAILLSNMRGNGWARIATTIDGWKWSQPIGPEDVVLDGHGRPLA